MSEDQPISGDIRQEAAHWLSLREAGEWTPEVARQCKAWRAADSRHERAFAKAEALWNSLDATILTALAPAASGRRRWARFVSTTPMAGRSMNRWAGGAIAAALVLAIMSASDLPTRLRADAMTAVGERRSVTLPDGSIALLDTDSAIAIDAADGRTVRLLRGEAAFTVAPDRSHPFSVRSGDGSTTALGTRFIVRQEDGGTRVTVTEHAVQVAEGVDAKLLREGESLFYGRARIGQPHPIVIADADAWTRGHIRVVDAPLGAVIRELDRYHPGYIGVIGDGLAKRPVSGVFDVDDPVGAIDVIERTLGLASVRLTDRLILLHS